MKSIYKNSIISCVSLFLMVFPAQIAQNCSPFYYDDENGQVALFNPNVLDDQGGDQFYLQPDLWEWGKFVDPKKDYQRNCEEWQAQFSDSVSIKDIYAILYKTDPDDFLKAYNENNSGEILAKNTFTNLLFNKENRPYLDYLYTAFKIQFSHFADDDPWGLKREGEHYKGKFNPNKNWINIIDSIQNGTQDFSPFLKERYGYQLVLNYRYANYPQKCVDAFEYYLSNSTSIVKAWAYIHTAHAWFLLGNIPASNLAFALSFDGCESKRIRAIDGFNIEKTDSTLMLAKTSHARASIHVLNVIDNPGRGLKSIETIIQAQADYHYLPLLIQREINKVENWLLAPFLLSQKALMDIDWDKAKRKPQKEGDHYYYDDDWYWKDNPVNFDIRSKYYKHKNYQKDVAYLRQFRAALLKLIAKPAAKPQRDFLNLAIAHLYFLDFKSKEALFHLNQVSKKAKPAIQAQAHIQKVLILPQAGAITDKNIQAKLYQSLHWLEENKKLIHRFGRTISQLHLYLARVFYQKGKTPEAGLLYAQTSGTIKGDGGNGALFYSQNNSGYYQDIVFFDKYATLEDMDNTFEFYYKLNKTPFENYICGIKEEGNKKSKDIKTREKAFVNALLDVQGTIAFRQDKLKSAYRYFAQLPDNYWKKTYEFERYLDNPFPDKGNYYEANKTHIVERMLELKSKQTPDSLLLLANAYFNTSAHGEAWMMFSYGKYPDEEKKEIDYNSYHYNFHPNAEKYGHIYYKLSRSAHYYKKILNHKKATLEQKATAAFWIGKIEKIADDSGKYSDYDNRKFPPHHYILFRQFKKAKNYDHLMSCTRFYYDFKAHKYTDKNTGDNY